MAEFSLTFFKEEWDVKILILMVCAQRAQFGPLSDDKPTLLLGGLASLVVGAREALQKWGKVADP